jgi:hypothetical protein
MTKAERKEAEANVPKQLFSVSQTNTDFGEPSQYTLYVTPTNPVPYVGAVKVVYPDNVEIADKETFEKHCSITTTQTFAGSTNCRLDKNYDSTDPAVEGRRTFWLFNAFQDQEWYTSQLSIEIHMKNPKNNFPVEITGTDYKFSKILKIKEWFEKKWA